MAELLEEWGLGAALVHGGFSSVLALDPPAGRDGWPLTLSDPAAPVAGARAPRRRGRWRSAPSGLRKGDHIVDPRTGAARARASRGVGRGAPAAGRTRRAGARGRASRPPPSPTRSRPRSCCSSLDGDRGALRAQPGPRGLDPREPASAARTADARTHACLRHFGGSLDSGVTHAHDAPPPGTWPSPRGEAVERRRSRGATQDTSDCRPSRARPTGTTAGDEAMAGEDEKDKERRAGRSRRAEKARPARRAEGAVHGPGARPLRLRVAASSASTSRRRRRPRRAARGAGRPAGDQRRAARRRAPRARC